MSVLHVLFVCLTVFQLSEGNKIKGIIGRNVSFSWTFKRIMNDDIFILHNKTRLHEIRVDENPFLTRTLLDRVRLSISNTTDDNIMVNIDFSNITKNDAGTYKVIQSENSMDLDNSVHLITIDEKTIPRIEMAGHNIVNSTIILECRLPSPSNMEIVWKINGSLIGSHWRYSQNDRILSITNVTVDDQYNSYKCNESGNAVESDPYSIKISGPNAIKFVPNITMVQQYSGLNMSCHTDCYPICSWKWTKCDPSLGEVQVISTQDVLYIQNITRQEGGVYSCRVLNKLTGTSLENSTPIQIIYGPDVILFNSSNIIQLHENDSITISCSADCFPPCQIGWTVTNAEIMIPGGELKLVNVNRSCNYTCHVTNARKDNSTISDTIYVIVKSEIRLKTTTAMTSEGDDEEFPFKRQLLYVLIGAGSVVAVALLAYLSAKVRTCHRVDKAPNGNTFTVSNIADRDQNVKEEVLSEHYWTIVSNAKGELSSDIETDFVKRRQQQLDVQYLSLISGGSNEPVRNSDVIVYEGLDDYLNPIETCPVEVDDYLSPILTCPLELDDYIQPINSDPEKSEFVSTSR
ncbi:hypothetical protein ACJMK2_025677 [Sinanodonta woodiana]|uniref:Ig-like domain-containing protein n=1 Tax=Sinanodonta woodiana TaxID=1069815 RepID=A0ABD3XHR7_SINWO